MNDDGSFEIPTTEVAGTEGIPDVLREYATLGIGLKKAALRVVEAWVDATNIDKPYGVDGDTSLITAASQGDDAEVELYLDAGCDLTICIQRRCSAIASAACQGMDDCLMMLIAAAIEQNILLDNGVTLREKPNDRGEMPLILAETFLPLSMAGLTASRFSWTMAPIRTPPVSLASAPSFLLLS